MRSDWLLVSVLTIVAAIIPVRRCAPREQIVVRSVRHTMTEASVDAVYGCQDWLQHYDDVTIDAMTCDAEEWRDVGYVKCDATCSGERR